MRRSLTLLYVLHQSLQCCRNNPVILDWVGANRFGQIQIQIYENFVFSNTNAISFIQIQIQ